MDFDLANFLVRHATFIYQPCFHEYNSNASTIFYTSTDGYLLTLFRCSELSVSSRFFRNNYLFSRSCLSSVSLLSCQFVSMRN